MMAADIVEAAIDSVPDEMVPDETAVADSMDPIAVDEWQACEPFVCDLQPYDLVDPTPVVDPVIIDDSCLMIDDASLMVYEPIDIRVQFVSSDTDSSWAAYYYTVDSDGVLQGISVCASYDEPTIAAFVAEHADDPTVEICDYGGGWWITGFPAESAPPVPDACQSYGLCGGGLSTADACSGVGTADGSGSIAVVGGWSWDDVSGTCTWNDGSGGATSTWEDSAVFVTGDWSWDDASWNASSWNDWACGVSSVGPLFYARGASMDDASSGGFSDPSEPLGAGGTQESDGAVVETVAASPRSAAFADMGTMAAAATAMQAGSAEAVVIGGGRRRR